MAKKKRNPREHATRPPASTHRSKEATCKAYVRNLAALWATDPTLAREVEALDNESSVPAPGAAGADTTRRANEPDSGLSTALDTVDPQKHFAFHVYGVGPHLLRLFDRLGGGESEAALVAFEPSLTWLRDELAGTDYSELIRSRRMLIVTDVDGQIADRLSPFTSLINLGFIGIRHEPSLRRDPAFFAAAMRRVEDFISLARTNLATTIQHGQKTARNLCDNLRAYVRSGSIDRLRNTFAGRPAIIVSAGPSLRRNIDRLREARGRAVIIAVQTTLRPLLEAGITPDFVTALDHHEISSRFYENLPPGLTTELVAEPKVSRKVIDAWCSDPKRKLTLLGNSFLDSVLRELQLQRPTLPPGATVAHLAFSLAEHLGCDAAILVGQDLGFSDGLAYTPGTSYDDVWRPETGRFCTFEMRQWEHIARDRLALRRIEDWRGNATYTEQRLFTYLQQFERMFAATRMQVIDSTEGGVAKQHTTRMTLAEALEQFCTIPLNTAPEFAVSTAPAQEEAIQNAVDRRVEEAREIVRISDETLDLLQALEAQLDQPERANQTIGRIDGLRAQLRAHDATYQLLLGLTQTSELERFRADRRIHAAGLDGQLSPKDKQKLQLERDQVNVRAIRQAAGDFIRALDPGQSMKLVCRPAESVAA